MGIRRQLANCKRIVIHCADTPNGRHVSAHSIDQWHQARGFKRDLRIPLEFDPIAATHEPALAHIGYHYVVELDGQIVRGRPLTETGAHVEHHNHDTIGICLIGRDRYTREQWASLSQLLQHLRSQLPNLTEILGHCELNPGKTCPGFHVAAWLNNGEQPLSDHIWPQPEQPA
jgi:N-acetylmuramoyl-L-alanine amidase